MRRLPGAGPRARRARHGRDRRPGIPGRAVGGGAPGGDEFGGVPGRRQGRPGRSGRGGRHAGRGSGAGRPVRPRRRLPVPAAGGGHHRRVAAAGRGDRQLRVRRRADGLDQRLLLHADGQRVRGLAVRPGGVLPVVQLPPAARVRARPPAGQVRQRRRGRGGAVPHRQRRGDCVGRGEGGGGRPPGLRLHAVRAARLLLAVPVHQVRRLQADVRPEAAAQPRLPHLRPDHLGRHRAGRRQQRGEAPQLAPRPVLARDDGGHRLRRLVAGQGRFPRDLGRSARAASAVRRRRPSPARAVHGGGPLAADLSRRRP